MDFPDLLLLARRRASLRQKALAALCDVDPSYIASLESGRRGPPSDVILKRLLDALGVSPAECALIDNAAYRSRLQKHLSLASPGKLSADIQELVTVLPMLTPTQIRTLNRMAKVLVAHDRMEGEGGM